MADHPLQPGQSAPQPGSPTEENLRAQLEEAQRRIAFLYEATSALFEDARGHRAMLAKLARLVVPHLADWCLVHLVGDHATERVAAEHWNPDLLARAAALPPAWPLDPGARSGLGAVAGTGRCQRVEAVGPAEPDEPEDVQALRGLGVRSWMMLPLRVRGRVRAVVTLAHAESTRRYAAADLTLAEDLASRAAMALDNALLFEEVERAVRSREDTLSIVSHDLKNPMSAILLGLQRLGRLADDARRPQVEALIGKLDRTVRGMNRLIEGLLDLARMEAGRLELDRRLEPAAVVVARALEPLEPLAADKRQRLELEVPADLPAVEWDPDRMAQVFSNLVGNAIKFSPQGGLIRVRGERHPSGLRFAVSDDGPGIPPELLERLFDRYWQTPGSGKRGHGLGLFIVKGLVEAHGGRVWVETQLGRGSTFYFTAPARALTALVP
jgi:signal transduction histidine kinase